MVITEEDVGFVTNNRLREGRSLVAAEGFTQLSVMNTGKAWGMMDAKSWKRTIMAEGISESGLRKTLPYTWTLSNWYYWNKYI